ncbi:hypothetical protein [Kribbella italica]|uniref:Uncharacterized protein n=1 Tax=Kribbella italica TaxID=1540520 RepID=A0A7W9JAP2_9ACTN|nr:hypothetical protein [Kribbella italica]MBB5838701.1 hypothetical protein [Kribbella italica]
MNDKQRELAETMLECDRRNIEVILALDAALARLRYEQQWAKENLNDDDGGNYWDRLRALRNKRDQLISEIMVPQTLIDYALGTYSYQGQVYRRDVR